jgi:hypothetical protein
MVTLPMSAADLDHEAGQHSRTGPAPLVRQAQADRKLNHEQPQTAGSGRAPPDPDKINP